MTNARSLANFATGIGTEGAVLTVDNTNNRIGIATTNPQNDLQVGLGITMEGDTGQVTFVGVVTASSFSGDITGDITGTASNASGATGDFSIADKIVHTGDTNTAIRFPSADTFTVETAGTERLHIDSSGNMGLNATPEDWESGQFFAFQFGKGGAVYGRAAGDEDRNGFVSNCYHDSAGWKYIASSAHATRYDQNDGNHIWNTAGTGTADAAVSFSESARIDTSGRLLISTTAARTNFNDSTIETRLQIEVAGDNDSAALSIISNAGTTNSDKRSGLLVLGRTRGTSIGSNTVVVQDDQVGMIEFKGMDGTSFTTAASIKAQVDAAVGTDDMPGRLVFSTTADNAAVPTERLRISSTGKHTITGATNGELSIKAGSSSGNDIIAFLNSSGTTRGNLTYDTDNNFLLFNVNADERLRIDSSGRLLIGHDASVNITGVESHLQIAGTNTESSSLSLERFSNDSGGPFLILAKSRNASKGGNTVVQDDDTIGRITFQGADGSDYEEAASIKGEVDGSPADDTTDMPGRLIFSTTADGDHNATERLRITSSGNIGIGSDSPTAPLNVVNSNSTTPTTWIRNTSGSGDSPALRVQGGANNDNTVGTFEVRDFDGNVDFKVGGTGTVTIGNGNLVFSTSGNGIDFSATADGSGTTTSELFDDYEEGTWTPAFTCTSANFSYTDQSGLYTKIGNIVIINFRIQLSSRTSGSGALSVTGLPFTPADNRCAMSISPAFGTWGSNNAPISGFITNGDILLKKFDSSNAQDTQDTNVDPTIVSTAGLIGSMSYKID